MRNFFYKLIFWFIAGIGVFGLSSFFLIDDRQEMGVRLLISAFSIFALIVLANEINPRKNQENKKISNEKEKDRNKKKRKLFKNFLIHNLSLCFLISFAVLIYSPEKNLLYFIGTFLGALLPAAFLAILLLIFEHYFVSLIISVKSLGIIIYQIFIFLFRRFFGKNSKKKKDK